MAIGSTTVDRHKMFEAIEIKEEYYTTKITKTTESKEKVERRQKKELESYMFRTSLFEAIDNCNLERLEVLIKDPLSKELSAYDKKLIMKTLSSLRETMGVLYKPLYKNGKISTKVNIVQILGRWDEKICIAFAIDHMNLNVKNELSEKGKEWQISPITDKQKRYDTFTCYKASAILTLRNFKDEIEELLNLGNGLNAANSKVR